MYYGHPQEMQMSGRVPIAVGLMAASFTSEILAPARTKAVATPAILARVMRLHDFDENAADISLMRDERPKLKAAPRAVPADRLPLGIGAPAHGLCRLAIRSHPGDGPYCEVGGEPEALADWPVTLRLQFVLTGHDVQGFAREAPAGLGKCLNRRCHLGAIGVTAIKSDSRWSA